MIKVLVRFRTEASQHQPSLGRARMILPNPPSLPSIPEGRIPSRNDLLYIGATSPLINVVDGRMEDVRLHRAALSPEHIPIAIHVGTVNKTFFTYGGARRERNRLLHMVSAYDHETGKVARPWILLDKHTSDAHDNPTTALDSDGHIWIFSNAHGTGRPAYIHRSTEPHSIDAFEWQVTTNFSYSQPWYLDDHGFVFLHTRYGGGRVLYVETSDDGVNWENLTTLAQIRHANVRRSPLDR